MKTSVTIKDIAEQLNLSRNTVAKALNGKYVPDATRELVLKKAREMNYKQLGTTEETNENRPVQRHRVLLLSGKPLNNMTFFTPIIRGIENYCFTHHVELFQYTFNTTRQTFTSFASYVKLLNVNGIIAIECFESDFNCKLLNIGIPTCFIDFSVRAPDTKYDYDVVCTGSWQPVYEFTRKIVQKYNFKHFCFVGDFQHCKSFHDRYLGMVEALYMEGVPHSMRNDILRRDNFNYSNAEAIKSEILKLKNLPQCFICSNDFIARSTCNALKLLNLRIPSQCIVVGYDNGAEAYSLTPTITTFSTETEQLGILAISSLLKRIATPTIPKHIIQIESKFIPRSSTKNYPLD